ncbi:hypothetical protein NA57DRAFT_81111 [Rhizodiscina lignyota]|uniref:Uncharacterized protein n=1 Tax=Rhizodiscina lignyota TaxID=1504668 RepID=A0A9P4M592_9PEZI|nr:hypothetical protein NA57DRAFT_81111 [Rhizodiscina lignyota]
MLASVAKFLNNAVALEKTLRLVQALTQIGVALTTSQAAAAPWLLTRSQVAVSRRFFRLHKWIDCGTAALAIYSSGGLNDTIVLLNFSKQTFLSIYFFLEMLTISNAIGITNAQWELDIFREASKFWFYAIGTSFLTSAYAIMLIMFRVKPAADNNTNENASKSNPTTGTGPPEAELQKYRARFYKDFISDGCDLLIPGSFLGWIPAAPLYVGIAMSTSTLLTLSDLWAIIQYGRQEPNYYVALSQQLKGQRSQNGGSKEPRTAKENGVKEL